MKLTICFALVAAANAELKGHWDWSTETLQVNVKRALANAKGDQITTGIGWKEVDFSNRGKWNALTKKDNEAMVKRGAKSWAVMRAPEGENFMILNSLPASEAGHKSPEFMPEAKFAVLKGPEGLDSGGDVVTAQFRISPHPGHKKKKSKDSDLERDLDADFEREHKFHPGFHKWSVWKEWHQGQWSWPKWSESEPDLPLADGEVQPADSSTETKTTTEEKAPTEAAAAPAAESAAPTADASVAPSLERDFMSLERDVESLADPSAPKTHPWFGMYDWGVWFGASPYVFQKSSKKRKD